MVANVGRATTPEVALRRALHAAGLRFRKVVRPDPTLRCAADVVFPRQIICIFVDGCFWHGCKSHFAVPKTNAAWWQEKIQSTVDRDCRQTALLQQRGWRVLRVWEHDLSRHGIATVVARIASVLHEPEGSIGVSSGVSAGT
jgi:DNA mismatch endonuclease (patch repair protein)